MFIKNNDNYNTYIHETFRTVQINAYKHFIFK